MAAIPTSDREIVARIQHWSNQRQLGWILPGLLTVVILAAGIVEWVYSPIERALGAFMYSTQHARVEAGQGWELNRESTEAMDALSQLSSRTQHRRNAGGTLETWEQIPAILDSFQVFSVSPDRFLTLYSQLPSALQTNLVDPIDLLRTRSSGDWRRVFFVQEDDDYYVYLISAENLVLHQSRLSDKFFDRYNALSQPIESSLDELNNFPLIMDAETFFRTLAPKGTVELDGDDIRWISNLDGEFTRIGLSRKPEDDLWQVAFETRQGDETLVYTYWFTEDVGRELANELREMLPRGGFGL